MKHLTKLSVFAAALAAIFAITACAPSGRPCLIGVDRGCTVEVEREIQLEKVTATSAAVNAA